VYVSVGVTIGRGRPATEDEIQDDEIAKALGECLKWEGEKCARREVMVVERISDNTPVADGTKIQMMLEYLAYQDEAGTSLESGRVGYLYVINRVQYPDGKQSAPRLIYPTRRTFKGNSSVLPGKPVMLPAPRELWQITRNRVAAQAYETYIIIVSPEPLKDSQGTVLKGNNLGETGLDLSETLVADWVRLWGGGEIKSHIGPEIGQLFTHREQAASGDPTTTRDTIPLSTDLVKSDPQPQMGFRKAVAPGGKMLITIKLPFRETVTSTPGRDLLPR
jgi:hypothetical protein